MWGLVSDSVSCRSKVGVVALHDTAVTSIMVTPGHDISSALQDIRA